MGDVLRFELMLDGLLCQICGGFLDGGAPGHPRWCEECAPDGVDELLVCRDENEVARAVKKALEAT